ncbi:MAG: hypothetical protein AAGU19_20925 [Prolixibacteraceae bacterium]
MKTVACYLSAVAITLILAVPATATAGPMQEAVIVNQEVNYQEIPTENVPETVTESLNKDYSGYLIDRAYLGDDGSYKLKVSQSDLKYIVFYKENGELIKVEESVSEEIEKGIEQGTEKVEEGVEDLKEELPEEE